MRSLSQHQEAACIVETELLGLRFSFLEQMRYSQAPIFASWADAGVRCGTSCVRLGARQMRFCPSRSQVAASFGDEGLVMRRPDDFHLHLRDGEGLKDVVPLTTANFARATIMPNLLPPVTTTSMVGLLVLVILHVFSVVD